MYVVLIGVQILCLPGLWLKAWLGLLRHSVRCGVCLVQMPGEQVAVGKDGGLDPFYLFRSRALQVGSRQAAGQEPAAQANNRHSCSSVGT